ncbi:Membrane carboxypeptidase (penicillin-binding protein) [Quadrisphaera granulorum]|uniref:Membrane peptidoglycan carboxypeptidase n=1 Tax=Quadrisphaera granulorum TaxID=317664 RepID=A0A315ZPX5_9ACTN|nr:transglycosylase domain-containing protein [Quadrisphaera granulorum]PWJ47359.1 membrane peptidoglycan carboxypeptidase [Quadrisphaera granulorum]SZE98806.1 Membrane carboxypeptidase (penicillin-binding protein) [Quadrisphaera granulorum]
MPLRTSFGRSTRLLAGFLAVSASAGLLVAGLAAPAVLGLGLTTGDSVVSLNSLPASLDQPTLSQQSRILYADGTPMATFYYENRISVPLDKVAPVMQKALIDIEDNRFYEHGGVDPRGVARAIVDDLTGGDEQGASTLTQQWIKNQQVEQALAALPPNATPEQRQKVFDEVTVRSGIDGIVRKLREMRLAIAADKKYSKQQILENYLNIANFGGGQYGIEAASEHWFDKSAAQLDLPEAALLAGIVQNPTGYDPVNHPDAAKQRRDTVLDRMLQLGDIAQAQHDAAVAVPIASMLHVQPTPDGCAQAGSAAYFCDDVVGQFLDDDAFGGTRADRLAQLYRGGLTITTTLDPHAQQAAAAEVTSAVPAGNSTVRNNKIVNGNVVQLPGTSGVGAAIVSVQPGTGKIVAMAQNRTYSTADDAPPTDTSINYSTDAADGGSGGFQPGSNFKPFVLATWLAAGHSLYDTVDGSERTFPNDSWQYGRCEPAGTPYTGKPWAPKNAGDGEGTSSMTVLHATADSINTGYAAMENQLPLCDVAATAQALGMHKAQPDTHNPTGKKSTDLTVTPSMTLGIDSVSPLTVASAYAAFAAEGKYCTPTAITSITGPDGKALPVPPSTCTQAIPQEVADGVTYALQRVLTQGTAAGDGLAGGREAAGKTGTTNNSVAAWFTGYTPQLATAVWVGVPSGSMSLNGAVINGHRYSEMYGGTLAAPMWQAYMDKALAGAPREDFTAPLASIIGTPPAPPASTSSPSSLSSPAPSQSSGDNGGASTDQPSQDAGGAAQAGGGSAPQAGSGQPAGGGQPAGDQRAAGNGDGSAQPAPGGTPQG